LQTFDFIFHQRWQNAHDLVKYHLEELLPLTLEDAKDIGSSIVIIFSFDRMGQPPDRAPDEVLDVLSQAARCAEKEGISLAVEVEDGFWADTGARTAEMIRAINQPSLGVNWDPANAAAAGDHPFPDGYLAVNQFVRHVHFKDLQRNLQGNVEYTIQGEIDWKGQIEALKNDGYQGYISVETHVQPKVACARMMTERLQALLMASEK
jgi:sugar phosphate isomerase/epimerase